MLMTNMLMTSCLPNHPSCTPLALSAADFFGPEVYGDTSEDAWQRYMNDDSELLLTCHLYTCS